jgi:hypothetical protein
MHVGSVLAGPASDLRLGRTGEGQQDEGKASCEGFSLRSQPRRSPSP